ncbi:hypothetical protein [Bosea sp. PAMC 26642]|uniref:hypothetical protein n=1 Tax=Bosea sp. (strain PAMC 26642) TaxID=1792307 RepID=UPI00076FE528|nr:hypothetical protein [Bosea sp. PAMC 26642]AMJ63120.1 hypothetical protein AXW83_24955 [Bosea sp. PAMC 26642]
MALAAEDVARSLRGSWRLMSQGAKALPELDLSSEGFLRSYGAAVLTVPAMVAVLAAERTMSGLPNSEGLFHSTPLVIAVLVSQVAAFLCVPALLIALAPPLLRSPALSGFIIAWNWTEILAASLLAVPAAVHAIGWSTPTIATMHWLAFAAIVAKLRYATAKATLGAERGVALMIVCASFLGQLGVARLLGLWGF